MTGNEFRSLPLKGRHIHFWHSGARDGALINRTGVDKNLHRPPPRDSGYQLLGFPDIKPSGVTVQLLHVADGRNATTYAHSQQHGSPEKTLLNTHLLGSTRLPTIEALLRPSDTGHLTRDLQTSKSPQAVFFWWNCPLAIRLPAGDLEVLVTLR